MVKPHSALVVSISTLSCVIGLNPPAWAATAPPGANTAPQHPTVRQCIDRYKGGGDKSFVIEGWPQRLVSGPIVASNGTSYGLYCGTSNSGVIHIHYGDRPGQGHPISPGMEESFLGCWNLTLSRGKPQSRPGLPGFEYTYRQSPPGVAIAGARDSGGRGVTVTLYTRDPGGIGLGNDWSGCAGQAEQVPVNVGAAPTVQPAPGVSASPRATVAPTMPVSPVAPQPPAGRPAPAQPPMQRAPSAPPIEVAPEIEPELVPIP
jgi:hypothetical protein